MPIAARCPSCAAPLSETSVLALAPVCSHCGIVVTNIGGTLGMTGAFGLSDPEVARRRCDADLAVLNEYLQKYDGMKHACIEQLAWNTERYATLPAQPKLLDVESKGEGTVGTVLGIVAAFLTILALGTAPLVVIITAGLGLVSALGTSGPVKALISIPVIGVALLGMLAPPVLAYLSISGLVKRYATRDEKDENGSRQREYRELLAQSLRDAEPRKAAADHRLRFQIRELESLAKTVAEKEIAVSRLRRSL